MFPSDTDEKARAAQLAVLRRLGPAERVRLAAEMSEDIRRIAFAAEQRRHPELSAADARQAVLDRIWGSRLGRSRTTHPRGLLMGSEVSDLLGRVARLLDLAGIPFMVAGSFASTAHGIPRSTQDLDLVIDPPNTAAFEALLASIPTDEYYVDAQAAGDALRRRSMFNLIDLASGWKVDLILRKNREFSRDEFSRRMQMNILGVRVFVATPEDTIVAKLEWSKLAAGSQRQRRDVAGIVATIGAALDRAYIEAWVRDLDLADEWEAAQTTET